MLIKPDDWARLHSVILWANMTTNAFALHIGLPRAENLYQIKRGHYGISLRLASRIVARFPEINKLWLLTGEGEMFVDNQMRSVVIPYYDEDVCRAVGVVAELRPVSEIAVPAIAKCDFAMRHDGESPDDGVTIVLLRRCGGEPATAAGEFVVVSEGIGELVRTQKGVQMPQAVCEVVGRIMLKDMGTRL